MQDTGNRKVAQQARIVWDDIPVTRTTSAKKAGAHINIAAFRKLVVRGFDARPKEN
jgi:hypothetical protein